MSGLLSRRKLFQAAFNAAGLGPERDVLVCVFLRGGADGLNLVVPFGDPAYYTHRPTLSIPRPDHKGGAEQKGGKAIELTDFFGLHPTLEPLHEIYRRGELLAVHAVGSDDQTRSHFEAQDLMERAASLDTGVSGGWLARHLRSRPGPAPAALAALAIGPTIPESLRGAPGASAVDSLEEFQIGGRADSSDRLRGALADLYGGTEQGVAGVGRETLQVLETVDRLRKEPYQPAHGAEYPNGNFGRALREVARIIKAQVGLEVACVDLGGWDTHFVQGVTSGLLAGLATELANGLAAFHKDLGDSMKRVSVVCMTEFGRRSYENVSLGTDHGRGSVMFLMGGGIHGGRVLADWPGLEGDHLEGPGDLRVTTDYRVVLAEVLERRLGNDKHDKVFPGLQPVYKGVAKPA